MTLKNMKHIFNQVLNVIIMSTSHQARILLYQYLQFILGLRSLLLFRTIDIVRIEVHMRRNVRYFYFIHML